MPLIAIAAAYSDSTLRVNLQSMTNIRYQWQTSNGAHVRPFHALIHLALTPHPAQISINTC